MMKKVQKGFTLIELMIVVAIIGILAAVAIPAYQDYIGRAQAAEGMTLLGGAKTPLAEYYADNGTFPTAPSLIIPNVSGQYVSIVTWDATPTTNDATLIATFKSTGVNEGIAGYNLELETTNGGNSWTCQSDGNIEDKLLPSACK